MMASWMFNCRKVTELVSQSLDRELPFYQRVGIKVHLLMCHLCSGNRKQLLSLRETIRLFQGHDDGRDAPAAMPPETRKRLKKAVRRHLHP